MKRCLIGIILTVLLPLNVYSQETKKQKEKTIQNADSFKSALFYFEGKDNWWKRFEEKKPVEVKLNEWEVLWPGIELTEDGFAMTDDDSYTYIAKPNTNISSYYDKQSKILRVSLCHDVYVYKWEDQLGSFVFLGMETGR